MGGPELSNGAGRSFILSLLPGHPARVGWIKMAGLLTCGSSHIHPTFPARSNKPVAYGVAAHRSQLRGQLQIWQKVERVKPLPHCIPFSSGFTRTP